MVVVIKPQFVAHEDDKGRSTTIFSLDVSPDGSRLATAGLDQKIKIWNTQPLLEEHMEEDENCKKLLSTLGSHNGNVLCVRWSPDGQYLASGSDDMVAIVWEKDENGHGRKVFGQVEENHEVWKPVRRLVGHESDIMALAWSNDGYWLATGGSDRLIFVWDAQTFTMVKKINFHGGMVKGIAFDPAGELMTTQSDDRSVCVWRTTDWSLLSQLKDPFVDSPNASWFRRLSWSPEGTFLAIPNSVNNGVFVAGILKRKHWDQATSLIGHENVIDVAAFSPLSFVKNANKPGSGQNLCAVLAIAARNCISVWLTSQVRPIVVFDTIVDREILDLSWTRDGTTLYACSSEGRIAVMHFRLPELGNVAPPGSREAFLETWKFKRPARTDFVNGSGGGTGTAGKPNMLMARKGKNAARPASTALLPIPPAGAPQNITINKDGKRRIQPAFLGLGGIVAQPLSSVSSASNAASSASAAVYAPPIQPVASTSAIPYQHTPSMAGVQSYDDDDQSADDRPMPNGHGPQHRTSLQGVGVPSWGAPQDRPVQHAQYNNKKRKVAELDYDGSDEPANLAPHRPPGRTLGGDRQFAPYDGEPVEIMPAYIPETIVHVPQESLKLAVPATQAFQVLKWDKEDEEADKLEVRNYESSDRPSEVAQINAKGKPEWLDYVPSPIVLAAFSPYFSAISCQNQTLHVYSPNGRRLFSTLVLDAPCSYLDAAGHFLLAITARGTLAVWDVRKRKATFRPTSILPIVHTATEKNRKEAIIVSAKVRPNGYPIISLSNGTALTFDGELESWTEVSTTWWSKGSDCWEARSRASTKEGRGVVRTMESEANDYLVAQQKQDADYVMVDEDAEEVKPSIEGEEQAKLGNGEDWKMALTLGHLESRMAAAIVLDSLAEYKTFLSLYVRKLAEEAFRGKAEELVKELLGPVYHRPGREDSWQPHLLGVHKHTLLRDVTSIWGKSKNFSKLATETNDTLKKMLADT